MTAHPTAAGMHGAAGRVALVTGAGRGLGRAIALALGGAGWSVGVADLDLAAAEAVADRLAADRHRALPIALDVRDAASVTAAFDALEAGLGPAEALVANAGIYPSRDLLDMAEAEWDAVLDTNLKGTFLTCQAFARGRVAAGGGGAIVTLASTAAFSARPGAAHYATSKAGIAMLTRAMAQEWGPHGIRANAVAPGLIEVGSATLTQDYRDAFLPMVPRGRLGEPRDVAQAVVFLLSDAADFINGAVLPVDGGFLTGRALVRAR